MTQGEFLAFIFAAFMMYTPVKRLSRVNANLQQAIAAAERIFEMLDTHSEVTRAAGRAAAPPLRDSDRVRGRQLRVQTTAAGSPILQDVSFRVGAGQVIAMVGLSGAGKTTLVNLLPRFYDVTGGAILIDGVDIRDVTLRSLRSRSASSPRRRCCSTTRSRTTSPTARRARPGRRSRRRRARRTRTSSSRAAASGYETGIGERGQRLSGGQRQRLAIARALLKNSPILILDEATSSLDAESERLVQDALANLMRNRTAFVIAHRLSTVRRADKIVALERGRVAEIGRHEELLARSGGVYAKLYALQMFDREPEARPVAVQES